MMAQRLARRAEDREVPGSIPTRDQFLNHDQFYQLNQPGSKAASDSTLKQLTLAGYQILVHYFTLEDTGMR